MCQNQPKGFKKWNNGAQTHTRKASPQILTPWKKFKTSWKEIYKHILYINSLRPCVCPSVTTGRSEKWRWTQREKWREKEKWRWTQRKVTGKREDDRRMESFRGPETQVLRAKYRGPETQVLRVRSWNLASRAWNPGPESQISRSWNPGPESVRALLIGWSN